MKHKAIILLEMFLVILAGCSRIDKDFLKAAKEGKLDKVELLLAKGADINTRDKAGNTPLLIALMKGNLDLAKLLIEKGTEDLFLFRLFVDIYNKIGVRKGEKTINFKNYSSISNHVYLIDDIWLSQNFVDPATPSKK